VGNDVAPRALHARCHALGDVVNGASKEKCVWAAIDSFDHCDRKERTALSRGAPRPCRWPKGL